MIQNCKISLEPTICQPTTDYSSEIENIEIVPNEDAFLTTPESPFNFWTFSCLVNAIFSSKESVLKCLYPREEF